MAIVLVASAIAATTTIAVAMRSYNSYVNGTRQSLASRAKEAAEAGLNILIESLNQDHPEWLIEPYNGSGSWAISRAATGGCRENAGGNPTIEGTSNTYSDGTEGIYRLTSYTFNGNNFYGGIGSFEMEGEIRSSNNRLMASAKIYQDMSITTSVGLRVLFCRTIDYIPTKVCGHVKDFACSSLTNNMNRLTLRIYGRMDIPYVSIEDFFSNKL